ncbi:phage tail protein [Salmonella enterica]|nr:phage tail protein [Salmonella enterica]EJB8980650.1 phage tail protein [Salmonella enterica]EKI6050757.1 phage tail protein [Salmonella enterica]EKN0899793.1 phage tail protein [Salmonella enterica]EKO2123584.1 phage tail protein [Salmonella enterica]
MADYYSIITNRGKELEAEALASGRLIVLTHFVVGDSNGKQVKPDPAQIRLINETYRGDIAELVVSPEQSTQLMAKIVLPTGIGGFTVREVGLMTDAGELYAVANCPSIDKPVGGVSVNMQFRLAVSDTSNITLNVATGDGLFLRIDQNLKEIKARGAEAQKTSRESIGVLDGTTQQRGLVQLNSNVNSTSETQAATPAAVKIAMDNANARLAKDRNGADIPNVALFLQNLGIYDASTSQKGLVRLNGGVTNADDTLAATSGAVKIAYDAAIAAAEIAKTKWSAVDATISQKGIVMLSDNTGVPDSTTAATTTAVNYVLNQAAAAYSLAESKYTAGGATTGKAGLVQLVNSMGGSGSLVMPQAAVTTAIQTYPSLGKGQTLQDLRGSRSIDATYTNSTGFPIAVYVRISGGYSANLYAHVNGIEFGGGGSTASNISIATAFFIVPNGATYRVIASGSSIALQAWSELR